MLQTIQLLSGASQEYIIYHQMNSEASWNWPEESEVTSGRGSQDEGEKGWCEQKLEPEVVRACSDSRQKPIWQKQGGEF